jgi:hypothetical protein
MTEYGEPYEGEKNKGKLTAKAASGKGLASKDYDGDGKVESSSKEHAGAVHNAIQRKKGGVPDGKDTRKESVEFIGEVRSETEDSEKKIDTMPKGKKNKVKVFPTDSTSSKGIIRAHYENDSEVISEKKLTPKELKKREQIVNKLKEKYGKTSKTYAIATSVAKRVAEEMENKEPKLKKSEGGCEDSREIPTKINLIKNKMRSMGLKMSYEPEGDQIDEVLGGQSGDGYIGHPRLGIKNPVSGPKKAAKTAPNNTGLAGRLGNRASDLEAAMKELKQSYELDGTVISEREFDEPGEEDWRSDVRSHNKAVGYRGGYRPYRRGYQKPKPGTSGPGSQAKPAD